MIYSLKSLCKVFKRLGSYASLFVLMLLLILQAGFSPLAAQDSDSSALSNFLFEEMDSMTSIYSKARDYDKLFPLALAAINQATKLGSQEDTSYASMLYQLGYAYDFGMQDKATAVGYYEKALAIQTKKIPIHADCVLTMLALANTYKDQGRLQAAESLYLKAMNVGKQALGKKNIKYAETLNNLALLYNHLGRNYEAIPLFLKAKDIYKQVYGEQHSDYAEVLNNLASSFKAIGHLEKAEALYLKTKMIFKNELGEEHLDYATILNNLALLYDRMGHYESAEPMYLQAMEVCKKVVGDQHHYYATSLSNLAILYKELQNYVKAEPLYLKARNIYLKNFGEKHPTYAGSLTDLASLYSQMERFEEAEPLFLESIKIFKEIVGDQHPRYATSLNNLAFMYEKMGRIKEAEPLFLETIAIKKKLLGINHPRYAASLNSLTELYIEMGYYSKAWDCNYQLIVANTNLPLSRNINQSWADSIANADLKSINQMTLTLVNTCDLLDIEKKQGYQAKQVIIANLAIHLLKRCRDDYAGVSDKLRNLSASSNWTLRSLSVLNKITQVDKAFEMAEMNKSVLLMEASKANKVYIFGGLPDSLVRQEHQLHDQHDELEAKLLERRPKPEKDSLREVLNELNIGINTFRENIEKKYPKYSALKHKQTTASLGQIQSLLDDQTALLEYVIGDDIVYVFYVDKLKSCLLECKIRKDVLSRKINQLRHALSNYEFLIERPKQAYSNYTLPAHWFYQNLLEPVLDSAKGIKHLIIISDGDLGHLPFETFLVKNAPQRVESYANLHYLVKDYSISYDYSATLWKGNKENQTKQINGELLAMTANYNIKLAPDISELRLPAYLRLREMLPVLPAARKEVETLAKVFAGDFAFDTLASECLFKHKASQFGLIHLAMHGLLNNKNPILSSLAFSEDSDSTENNFLQAYEISQMELNASLVVLSACETGYGKFQKGNGIASLARAFMYAGVPSLVVSLWQVNDKSTSQIMQNFYHNLSVGMDKAEALRQAKLSYVSTSESFLGHPAFWSPFIQLGDSRVIQLDKKRSGPWAAAFFLVVVFAIFFLIRPKKWKNRKIA